MARNTLSFTECEHEGDMEHYLSDLRKSGAEIISSDINYDAETGEVVIEVTAEEIENFTNKFKETDSYDFSSLG